MTTRTSFRTRSLFGPLLLVGIGVVWLLANIGIINFKPNAGGLHIR